MWEKIKRLLQKHREVIRYLFVGGLTTLVGYGGYWLFADVLRLSMWNYTVANALSWLIAVLFAYLANKLYVFRSRTESRKALTRESASFFLSRVFSLGVESLIVFVGGLLPIWHWWPKLTASVVVVLLNYVTGKLLVFRTTRPRRGDGENTAEK